MRIFTQQLPRFHLTFNLVVESNTSTNINHISASRNGKRNAIVLFCYLTLPGLTSSLLIHTSFRVASTGFNSNRIVNCVALHRQSSYSYAFRRRKYNVVFPAMKMKCMCVASLIFDSLENVLNTLCGNRNCRDGSGGDGSDNYYLSCIFPFFHKFYYDIIYDAIFHLHFSERKKYLFVRT